MTAAMCTAGKEQLVCRVLVTAADDASHLVHQAGKVLWTREESLANVQAVEFVDLPVSDLEAAIESEFDQKEGSIWAAFSRRLQTQVQQLHTLLFEDKSASGPEPLVRDYFNLHKLIVLVTDVGKNSVSIWAAFSRRLQTQVQQLHTLLFEDKSTSGPEPLVRDYFNLHKLIVLVTDVGKIFGMDNLSGEILWRRYEPNLDSEGVVVYTRRSARHPPLDAYLTIVGKHAETGNGLIISLDPIRGVPVGERTLELDTPILQCALMHRVDNEKLHALILLDKDENVMVLPVSSAPLVENMFIYVAEKNTAKVQGYALKYDGRQVIAQKTWSVNLGGNNAVGHRIVTAVGKRPQERVHSAGRVLGDRSVLYKYSNPNLVLFVTEGPDALHKDVVVAYCVDAVSGAIVASQAHRKARALPLAVHSDNFMAYLYYNDKHRRTEIATLELYEGKTRWLAAGAAFSSLASERAPLVERQVYILSAVPTAAATTYTERSLTDKHVLCKRDGWLVFSSLASERAPLVERQVYILSAVPTAAATTYTERSLTDKHVLLALSTGAIIELPWEYLEPRRPVTPTPEQREEGLIPYAPEVPLPSEAVINYNMTLHKVRQIYTAAAGLESTSLVLATGLDLFYTRVAPSKTFDLLKDDFDYSLITIVLAALIIATYSTKHFASRKMLKQAWK
ncbi:ER membrane protein complex subunit 1 [Phthorimaea operculella]|nr:ER membrane protein complex subunit 1 [Phthorimaea operculella]